jgi:hypothetical protein
MKKTAQRTGAVMFRVVKDNALSAQVAAASDERLRTGVRWHPEAGEWGLLSHRVKGPKKAQRPFGITAARIHRVVRPGISAL